MSWWANVEGLAHKVSVLAHEAIQPVDDGGDAHGGAEGWAIPSDGGVHGGIPGGVEPPSVPPAPPPPPGPSLAADAAESSTGTGHSRAPRPLSPRTGPGPSPGPESVPAQPLLTAAPAQAAVAMAVPPETAAHVAALEDKLAKAITHLKRMVGENDGLRHMVAALQQQIRNAPPPPTPPPPQTSPQTPSEAEHVVQLQHELAQMRARLDEEVARMATLEAQNAEQLAAMADAHRALKRSSQDRIQALEQQLAAAAAAAAASSASPTRPSSAGESDHIAADASASLQAQLAKAKADNQRLFDGCKALKLRAKASEDARRALEAQLTEAQAAAAAAAAAAPAPAPAPADAAAAPSSDETATLRQQLVDLTAQLVEAQSNAAEQAAALADARTALSAAQTAIATLEQDHAAAEARAADAAEQHAAQHAAAAREASQAETRGAAQQAAHGAERAAWDVEREQLTHALHAARAAATGAATGMATVSASAAAPADGDAVKAAAAAMVEVVVAVQTALATMVDAARDATAAAGTDAATDETDASAADEDATASDEERAASALPPVAPLELALAQRLPPHWAEADSRLPGAVAAVEQVAGQLYAHVVMARRRIRRLRDGKGALQHEYESLVTKVSQMKAAVATKFEEHEQALAEALRQVADAAAVRDTLQAALDASIAQQTEGEAERERLQDQDERLQAEYDALQTRLAEATAQLAAVAHQDDADAALVSSETQRLERELQRLNAHLLQTQEEQTQQHLEQERRLDAAQQQIAQLESERDRIEQERAMDRSGADSLAQRLQELEAALQDAHTELAAVSSERDEYATGLANLQDVLAQFQADQATQIAQATAAHALAAATAQEERAAWRARAEHAEAALADQSADGRSLREVQRDLAARDVEVAKLRQAALQLQSHLAEAMRRLEHTRLTQAEAEQAAVDRRVLASALMTYLTAPRGDQTRLEVLGTIAKMVGFTEDERYRVGLSRVPPAARRASQSGSPRLLPGTPTAAPAAATSRDAGAATAGSGGSSSGGVARRSSESIGDAWLGFLLQASDRPPPAPSAPRSGSGAGDAASPRRGSHAGAASGSASSPPSVAADLASSTSTS